MNALKALRLIQLLLQALCFFGVALFAQSAAAGATNRQAKRVDSSIPHAVADLDDDGADEIVTVTRAGRIQIVRQNGKIVAQSRRLGRSRVDERAPVITDLDGDGEFDIVYAASGDPARVYAFNASARPLAGWEKGIALEGSRRVGTPLVADINGDSRLEVAVHSAEQGVILLAADGVPLAQGDVKAVAVSALIERGAAAGNAGHAATASNHAPVLTPIGDKTVAVGSELRFTIFAADPDGDAMALAWRRPPQGAQLDFETGEFYWKPKKRQVGRYSVRFIVKDGRGAQAMVVVIIQVVSGYRSDRR